MVLQFMLKPETERDKAHRVFKFYKATGKFPPDISNIQCYNLLCKYNYFIAKGLDQLTINKLTELCNIIESQHYIIVYGDFMLETLEFGLKNFKITKYSSVQIRYLDCSEQSISEHLNNSILLATHTNSYIVYICDNAESLKSRDIKWLTTHQKQFLESNKTLIFSYLTSEKIQATMTTCPKIRLGESYSAQLNYQQVLLSFFTNPQRSEVAQLLESYSDRLNYIMNLINYNLFSFFPENYNTNLAFLKTISRYIHKSDDDKVIQALSYGFIPAKAKHIIRFPPKVKTEDDNDEL